MQALQLTQCSSMEMFTKRQEQSIYSFQIINLDLKYRKILDLAHTTDSYNGIVEQKWFVVCTKHVVSVVLDVITGRSLCHVCQCKRVRMLHVASIQMVKALFFDVTEAFTVCTVALQHTDKWILKLCTERQEPHRTKRTNTLT